MSLRRQQQLSTHGNTAVPVMSLSNILKMGLLTLSNLLQDAMQQLLRHKLLNTHSMQKD